jgi:hypothetical protein
MERHWAVLITGLIVAGAMSAGNLPRILPRPNLTIAMQFDQPLSLASLHEMKSEFERIMLPAVPRIEWRMLDDVTGNETFNEVVVVRFNGSCEADGLRADLVKSRYLGTTNEQGGEVLPFSRIDCQAILWLLSRQSSVSSGSAFDIQFLVGRAMGRVLAHEVYHAVLKTSDHASHGIAKSKFTPAELLGANLTFEPEQIERLNATLSVFDPWLVN